MIEGLGEEGRRPLAFLILLSLLTASSGCSLRKTAINMVGDALASGDSVYETDDDLELVGGALPFGLKLTESLLEQSPDHPGLLLTACRGFTLYSYAYVAFEAERLTEVDLDRARALRQRARKLYLRGFRYGLRALERNHPGLERALLTDPAAAAARIGPKQRTRDLPLLYWTAAALGLAISVALDDAALLARLPEVEALIDRALTLDEAWDSGSLHEFKVTLAGGTSGRSGDRTTLEAHYTRALALSRGGRAGLFVAYAEAVSLPAQDKPGFQALLERAIAVDPDERPRERLATLVSQRRARWLLGRIDDLILSEEPGAASGDAR